MKYEVLDIFCERLNQRNMIKDFAIERKLLDLSELHRLDRKRTKEEREIASMLQPFARFNSPTNHEILINQLARERQLRQEMSNMMQRKLKGFAKASDSNSSTQRSHSNSFSSHQHLASNIPIDVIFH
jgi:transcriptional adapter 2-alpha